MRLVLVVALLGCSSSTPEGAGSVTPVVPVVIDGQALDAAVIDAPVVDAPVVDAPVVDAPVVDAAVIDAAIALPPRKRTPRAKRSRSACLEECRKRNQSTHCASDEGMVDCPCRCD